MAAEFTFKDEDMAAVKGKSVIVTGCSSGIGLATVKLLLGLGASVFGGDIQPPLESDLKGDFAFLKTDISVWKELVNLFKTTYEKYGRIDHVYANAGIGPTADYFSDAVDENGDLLEPSSRTYDITFKGNVNTATLAIYYMKKQPEFGTITFTASTSALQRERAIDYSASKHGVVGFGRAINAAFKANKIGIRVNTIAPAWTETPILKPVRPLADKLGIVIQPAEAVAKCVAYFMADPSQDGNLAVVQRSRYFELDDAVLLKAWNDMNQEAYSDEEILDRITQEMLIQKK
ncbi:(-)-trans-carveol dehydrogenase [Fusarium acutatum]|uniref:(-)-trans-carveol dehydrogenase n=1 Tax=Fusarium acutatum TaxID=78861 RepID=A0A8H4JFN8_9HYPO|nr:(-)-trans-carveol dehydrogenase [Fusarium acutatum]